MDIKKLRHDFINNSLRIEVLTKLIADQLQNEETVDQQYLEDLESFLYLMQQHLDNIKKSS